MIPIESYIFNCIYKYARQRRDERSEELFIGIREH